MESIIKEARSPMVIDADGLNSIAGNVSVLKKAKAPVVLTPHPGEMARLLGRAVADIQKARVSSAEGLAKKTGAIVCLKGAGTVVATPEGAVFVNPTGNAGLSSAGTGDVLTGMIAGMLSQGYSPVEATTSSVYVHGTTADWIKKRRGESGIIATDLLAEIPGVLNQLSAP
jgi:NAD(P)H-hydrate epimerase